MPKRSDKLRIGILIFPQAEVLDITGPHEVFSMALGFQQQRKSSNLYEVFLISKNLKPVEMSSGMKLVPDYQFKDCPLPIDTLIVPGSEFIEQVLDDVDFIDWIKKQSKKVRRLVSICTGAFFLAKAGLLDGKKVTTHWGFCPLLQKTYPNLKVVSDAIYIKDGDTYTSAGITAGMDLSLALIEEDVGKDLAMSVARKLVLFYKRPGGQNQFSEFILSQSNSHFKDLIDWIIDHLSEELSINKLAEKASMSPRNFTRQFKKELGVTPAKFIEHLRLRQARMLLENKVSALKSVANQCGFKSEEQMRRAFQRELCVTPQEYRTRF
jgi:transcriptional regulator GlxA family with amidase domain